MKVTGLEARKPIKRRLRHRCFLVNIAKFLRAALFYRTTLVAASGIEAFFLFVIHTTLKLMKIL